MKIWTHKVLFVLPVFLFFASIVEADSFTNKIKSYGEELFACESDDQCVWAQKECCGGVMVISRDYEKRWDSFWQAQCRGSDCPDPVIPGGVFSRCVSNQCQIVRDPSTAKSTGPTEMQEEPAAAPDEQLQPEPVIRETPEPLVKTNLPKKEKVVRKPQFDLNTVCSELARRADQEKCYLEKMDNGRISAGVCEGLKKVSSRQTEECYMEMAHQTGDLFFCNEIENPDNRFACYHQETKGRVK